MPTPEEIAAYYADLNAGTIPAVGYEDALNPQPVSDPFQLVYPGPANTPPPVEPQLVSPNLQSGGDVQPQQVPSPLSVGTSDSFSVSRSGVDPTRLANVEKRNLGKTDKVRASFDSQANQAKADYLAINEQEKQSQIDQSRIQSEKFTEEAKSQANIAAITDSYLEDTKKIMAQGKAEFDQYRAQRDVMMQEIRATNINPGKLFADMTGGEKAGMLVTAFVTDYLGSQGVKTSAMDTYSRAVERSIDAQIANLGNKKFALSEFDNLYRMVREQSATEEETRAKLHAIGLQSFRDNVASKMSTFNSRLNDARLGETLAGLDKKAMDKNFEIDGIMQQRANQDIQLRLREREVNLEAAKTAESIRASRAASARAQAEFEAKRAAGPAGITEDVRKRILVDPSKNQVLGNRVWIARDEKETPKIQAKVNAAARLVEQANDYSSLANKLGKKYDGPLQNYIERDPEVFQMFQLRDQIVDTIVTARAASTFTDAYLKRIEAKIPKDSLLTAKKAAQLSGQLAKITSEDIDAELTGFADIADEETTKYQQARVPKRQEGTTQGDVQSVDERVFGAENRQVAEDWRTSIEPKTYEADKLAGSVLSDENYGNTGVKYSFGNRQSKPLEDNMNKIFKLANDNSVEPEQRQRAYEVLNNFAYDPGIEVNPLVSEYTLAASTLAKYYLNELGKGEDKQRLNSPEGKRQAQQFAKDYLQDYADSTYGK